MSRETLNQWLAQLLEDSAVYGSFFQNKKLDATMGWGELLELLLDQDQAERGDGLILAGPEGCGKHTLLAEAVQIAQESGYRTVFLTGDALMEGADGPACAMERVQAVLDWADGQEQPVCLVLEEIENLPCRAGLLRKLEQRLCKAHNENRDPFFLILLQHAAFRVPALLGSMLQICRVQYPNRARRRLFMQNHLSPDLYRGLEMEALLDWTDTFSYQDLSNLTGILQAAGRLLDNRIPEKNLQELVWGQKPEPSEIQSKAAFFARVEAVLDRLPDILERPLPQGEPRQSQSAAQQQPFGDSPGPQASKTLEELEQETGEQLIKEIFKEEDVQQLLRRSEEMNEGPPQSEEMQNQ